MERVAIYPGSFDPLTNGHVSIIERGLHIFDKIIVGIAVNVRKEPLFNVDEREAFIRESFPTQISRSRHFRGCSSTTAVQRDVAVILRGLRAVSDFEYELQMANMNRKLDDTIDTVFMMTEESDFYVSSSLVKEVARFGGKVEGVVPKHVEERLVERFSELDQGA